MLPVTASPFSSPAPTKTDSFNRTTGLFTDPEDYHHSIGSFYSLNETRQCRTQNHVRPHSLCRWIVRTNLIPSKTRSTSITMIMWISSIVTMPTVCFRLPSSSPLVEVGIRYHVPNIHNLYVDVIYTYVYSNYLYLSHFDVKGIK